MINTNKSVLHILTDNLDYQTSQLLIFMMILEGILGYDADK